MDATAGLSPLLSSIAGSPFLLQTRRPLIPTSHWGVGEGEDVGGVNIPDGSRRVTVCSGPRGRTQREGYTTRRRPGWDGGGNAGRRRGAPHRAPHRARPRASDGGRPRRTSGYRLISERYTAHERSNRQSRGITEPGKKAELSRVKRRWSTASAGEGRFRMERQSSRR